MTTPQPSSDAEDLFEAFSRSKIHGSLEPGHLWPLRWLLLWLGGADRKLLKYVPTEQKVFLVLGSSVLLTATVAGLLGYTTVGYLLYGRVTLQIATVAGGLICGLMILTIDRILVKAQLNPYSFPPVILAALFNPATDAASFVRLSAASMRPKLAARTADTFRVLRRSLIRLVIALCTSYLFSQAALFYFFSDEVEARAHTILDTQRGDRITSLMAQHTSAINSLQALIDSYNGDNDTQVKELTADVVRLTPLVNALSKDSATAAQLVAAEFDGGTVQCFTFVSPDGPGNKCSSGNHGYGDQYTAAVTLQTTINNDLAAQSSMLSSDRSQLEARRSAVQNDATSQQQVANAVKQIALLNEQYDKDIDSLRSGANDDVTGILIRHQALAKLDSDRHPDTPADDTPTACSAGVTGLPCKFWRLFVQPTPLGPYVGAFKVLFLAIELLPILLKITYSLRVRRPYDELDAALEEGLAANAIEMLDNELIQAGARLESRAAWRRARRGGSGAEFYLTETDTAAAPSQPDNPLLGAQGSRHRRRFWPRRK